MLCVGRPLDLADSFVVVALVEGEDLKIDDLVPRFRLDELFGCVVRHRFFPSPFRLGDWSLMRASAQRGGAVRISVE